MCCQLAEVGSQLCSKEGHRFQQKSRCPYCHVNKACSFCTPVFIGKHNEENRGLCTQCFARKYPDDERARFKIKELLIRDAITKEFDLDWVCDKTIDCTDCATDRLRPDMHVDFGTHFFDH